MKKLVKLTGFGLLLLFLFFSFITYSCKKKEVPIVTTSAITDITGTTAISGGTIKDKGTGIVLERGVCWSTGVTPTIADYKTTSGAGAGTFTNNISGLAEATTYYVRAFATNDIGTGYGMAMSFTTLVSDVEGNLYNTVKIGTQTWLRENLKVTKYNDTTAIPNVVSNTDWTSLSTGAYCWYINSASSNKNTYGALYNWYTISSGKLCPTGWHVPTITEWKILQISLGNRYELGIKLKEAGTTHWASPNTGVTNESGFTALPGGYRSSNGAFNNWENSSNGIDALWYSSTEENTQYADFYFLYDDNSGNQGYIPKNNGLSVRCVKDWSRP
jgi:uncharacterized protein (TIGR02145 family)